MRCIRPSAVLLWAMLAFAWGPALGAAVETALVQAEAPGEIYVADGYVEAVRQTVIASQVAGRVTALTAKAGDVVRNGQLLVRIDERAAVQQAAASQAQVAAARAQLEAAQKEYERSQRLHQKQYISQAAMDQAEAQFKAAQAQARSLLAQASAASTQTSLHSLHSPYSGVVTAVTTEIGDMALPGKPLMTVYDPAALRVIATVPERYAAAVSGGAVVRLEFPATPDNVRWQTARAVTVLPTHDAASHTFQVRLDLPAGGARLAPGTFARAHLPLAGEASGTLTIPTKAVVRRTELTAVYVAAANGKFQLRQVRLGKTTGERVAVLAGLAAGERVSLDPVAASRQ
ncbi:MAG: efflux RND transporter periplasmic adaptor subunit [Burkholderiales bacterium]